MLLTKQQVPFASSGFNCSFVVEFTYSDFWGDGDSPARQGHCSLSLHSLIIHLWGVWYFSLIVWYFSLILSYCSVCILRWWQRAKLSHLTVRKLPNKKGRVHTTCRGDMTGLSVHSEIHVVQGRTKGGRDGKGRIGTSLEGCLLLVQPPPPAPPPPLILPLPTITA